jgi:hypothetical protein
MKMENTESKYKRCTNCLYEGEKSAEKCLHNIIRAVMREGGKYCLNHEFRPDWELEGGLFDPEANR